VRYSPTLPNMGDIAQLLRHITQWVVPRRQDTIEIEDTLWPKYPSL
jgi:hypothetical protein